MTRRALPGEEGAAPAPRWLAAGAVALGLHAAVVLMLIRDARPEPLAAGGGDAIAVELDPVEGEVAKSDAAQPPAPADEAAVAAAAAADARASLAAVQPPAVEPPTPTPPPPVEPPPPEPPRPGEAVPDLPDPPPPPPAPEPPKPEAPRPEPTRPDVPPVQAAPPSAASAASAPAEDAAPAVQRLSQARVTAWRGKLVPHLNRFRRVLLGVGDGTVRIGFTVDAEGRVTDASIATSSGNAALDEAARALVRRASPFPPPPPGLSSAALSFVVPIHNGGGRP